MLLKKSALLLGATPVLMAAPIHAAEDAGESRDYLPEIIVTGSKDGYGSQDGSSGTKTDTALLDVPQSIQVITADQLADQAITNLNTALRFVPGVSLGTGEGHRDQINMRGQNSTADFYLDGLRDDAEYYRALYNVERIEVLKGANALIFGRGGAGGVVNRVTKTPSLNAPKHALSASLNTHDAFNISGDFGAPLAENMGARLNATYEEFASHRRAYKGRFTGLAPSLAMKVGDETRITLAYSYEDDERITDRGIPSLGGKPMTGADKVFFGDAAFNQSAITLHRTSANVAHQFTSNLSANFSAQYANYDKVYANILPRSTDGASAQFSGYRAAATRENTILQGNLIWDAATGPISHKIMVGAEQTWQDSAANRQDALFANGAGGTTARITLPLGESFSFPAISLSADKARNDSTLSVSSAYVQDQIAISEALQLIAGLRWDRFDLKVQNLLLTANTARTDTMVSPRLGMVAKPMDKLSLYASYATSFLPQSGQQFTALAEADAALEPEKFVNYELGAKFQPAADLLLTMAVFQVTRSNSKAADPANSGLYVLSGKSETKGVELGVTGRIIPSLSTNLGYTYMDGKITSATTSAAAGARLAQLPRHHFTAWNYWEFSEKAALGLGAIHQSKQNASLSGAVVLPAYWRFDAAAYYTLTKRAKLQVNIENIFGKAYYASAHGDNNIQPAAPRTANVTMKWEF